MPTRREVLRSAAGVAATLAAGRLLAPYLSGPARFVREALAGPAPLPPPETTTIRLGAAPCDAPIMAAEPYLEQEGFTRPEILASAPLESGRTDINIAFPLTIAQLVEAKQDVVVLGALHPGCAEIFAQPGIRSLQDLRGRTVVVTAKTLANFGYSYVAIVLKHAGVDPAQVNFVVQPGANPVNLFLEGRNDAVVAFTTGVAALHSNPANPGHVIHNQLMDLPWGRLACCYLVARREWYRANPIAAKRAVRAVFRAADAQTASRADAVKRATDRGLFGGPANFDNVLYAASMVPANWRDLDLERALRFYGQLLVDVGLLKVRVEDVVRTIDSRILEELRAELKS